MWFGRIKCNIDGLDTDNRNTENVKHVEYTTFLRQFKDLH